MMDLNGFNVKIKSIFRIDVTVAFSIFFITKVIILYLVKFFHNIFFLSYNNFIQHMS